MPSRSKPQAKPAAALLRTSAPTAPVRGKGLRWPGPLAEMAPEQRNITLAVSVSLLLHAMVLAIHFDLPEALSRVKQDALDVVLVNSKHARKPAHAQARAQTNLDAGGNSEDDRRARTPLPPSTETRDGDDVVDAQRRVQELEAEQRRIMSQLQADKSIGSAMRQSDTQPVPAPAHLSGLDMADRALAIARLEGQIDRQFDEYNKRPRKKFIGVRTEEYLPAQYLEDWRQKVERVGNLNYPEAAKGRFYGSLVVYIEINSEGELERAEVQRSSGHRVLDDAALRILRLAAPFGKFPSQLKRQTDILAFARTWTFTQADQLHSQ